MITLPVVACVYKMYLLRLAVYECHLHKYQNNKDCFVSRNDSRILLSPDHVLLIEIFISMCLCLHVFVIMIHELVMQGNTAKVLIRSVLPVRPVSCMFTGR